MEPEENADYVRIEQLYNQTQKKTQKNWKEYKKSAFVFEVHFCSEMPLLFCFVSANFRTAYLRKLQLQCICVTTFQAPKSYGASASLGRKFLHCYATYVILFCHVCYVIAPTPYPPSSLRCGPNCQSAATLPTLAL